ncbi:hypothetical protein HI914_01957 [Erysiphe necator]|nr:hypothetical protein HI914_01957 [Erysiphe necator]
MLFLAFAFIYASLCFAVIDVFFDKDLGNQEIKYQGPMSNEIKCDSVIYTEADIRAAIQKFYHLLLLKELKPDHPEIQNLNIPKLFHPAQRDPAYTAGQIFYEFPIHNAQSPVDGPAKHHLIFTHKYHLHSAVNKNIDPRIDESQQKPFYRHCSMKLFQKPVK